ncbi:RNA polymerase subunit sigma-70 [Actinacidiphila oryziradicis]|jgi:DNA-directed RNA polymerase specialized sigma24 family protein|uniref:RNA polymerase subunit sigma-70 n=2 Tax=Actinacidiphila oryziradicis TaxID=2571141 RepID=A0A4U0STM2_9ACTN|nr:RNA polymerase subunit sigma-70 [Actinacidiphila oryziradicis]
MLPRRTLSPRQDAPDRRVAEYAVMQTFVSSPEAAFDALYYRSASSLIRQLDLLTGRPRLARRAVRRAFVLAWERWPEVAVAPDPAAWVRAAAYAEGLAPWRRNRRKASARRHDAELRTALLRLPRSYRQAVLLYDGVGLDLPETAAESQASTPAAAGRITRGRAALTEAAPGPEPGLPARLAALLAVDCAAMVPWAPPAVRRRSERRTRRLTAGALALTAAVAAATLYAATTEAERRMPAVPEAGTGASTDAGAPDLPKVRRGEFSPQ